jgi:hypothetical protein
MLAISSSGEYRGTSVTGAAAGFAGGIARGAAGATA